ncbi:heme-binding domain-containing protein [Myxococcota bacterium]|nr:heme-binding domain-containing protein [Myxococcota bacterium]
MKKNHILILLILGLLGGLSFPMANIAFPPDNAGLLAERDEAAYPHWNAAMDVMTTKCVHCHSANAKLPFYASFPIASSMMQADVDLGRAAMDLPKELYRDGKYPISEATLAKIEFALAEESMPPMRYLTLHWNHGLNASDKETLLTWAKETRAKYFKTDSVAEAFANDPIQPLPEVKGLDAAKVALGDKLFFDKRLSTDDTLSCAGCHGMDMGGSDMAKSSTGVRGQVGPINSPTVFNSGFQISQFWDGNAPDLKAQADGPVNNPVEMGSNWAEAIPKLKADEALLAEIVAIYGEGFTDNELREAIAEFEKSMVTPSPFDAFLKGDDAALNADEKKGFEVFKTAGCARCHVGKVLGGQSYEKMGLYKDYFAGREPTTADLGRFNFTKDENDKFYFKVPMLRNIEVTPPYFHDGSTGNLEEAVKVMSDHQLVNKLSDEEMKSVIAFLKSLTGTYKGEKLKLRAKN